MNLLRRIRLLKMYGTFRWSKVKWEFCHICGCAAPIRKSGTFGAHPWRARDNNVIDYPCEGIGQFPRPLTLRVAERPLTLRVAELE